jgi:hypothetical protein
MTYFAAMLVHWWQRIGVGASLGWRWLRNSRAFAGQCCRVVGVVTLVGRWRCYGISADALVLKGEGPDNQGEKGERGEGDAQHDAAHQGGCGILGGPCGELGGVAGGMGGCAMNNAHAGSGIWGDAAVH